ncbi:MAG: hypothetical protein ACRCTW_11195 [Lactococcus garvieae]
MVDYENQCFEVNNDGEPIKVYYSVHSGWQPDKKKKVASFDLERTQAKNAHSYLSLSAVCDIASALSQLNQDLGDAHDV